MAKSAIAILGAGSWGTAVAIHLAQSNHAVKLWSHDPAQIAEMKKTGFNQRFLPDIKLPTMISPESDLSRVLDESEYVIIAVPSHAFASVLNQIDHPLPHLAWLTKGIEPQSFRFLSDLVCEKWGENFSYAVISGPSFAKEVAQSLPTALVIAGPNLTYLKTLHQLFHQNNIRTYLSQDSIGVQWCGAVKNVLAIACGISDGLHYGANAKAAIITRGLAEMTRMGLVLGAQQETFMGLAGVGDLVLTCTDDQSRNRRFGLRLGEGLNVEAAEKQVGQVVEGKHNAAQVCALAKQHQIEMPICQQVMQLLQGHLSARQAFEMLMKRPPKAENNNNPLSFI